MSGVIWYVTVAVLYEVLVRISEITVTPVNWGLVNPVTEPAGLQKAVQVKSAPLTLEVNITFVEEPEHICDDSGLFDRSGFGLTVTIKSNAGPVHPFADGMMV